MIGWLVICAFCMQTRLNITQQLASGWPQPVSVPVKWPLAVLAVLAARDEPLMAEVWTPVLRRACGPYAVGSSIQAGNYRAKCHGGAPYR